MAEVVYVDAGGGWGEHRLLSVDGAAVCVAVWTQDAAGRSVAYCPHYEVRLRAQRAFWEERMTFADACAYLCPTTEDDETRFAGPLEAHVWHNGASLYIDGPVNATDLEALAVWLRGRQGGPAPQDV